MDEEAKDFKPTQELTSSKTAPLADFVLNLPWNGTGKVSNRGRRARKKELLNNGTLPGDAKARGPSKMNAFLASQKLQSVKLKGQSSAAGLDKSVGPEMQNSMRTRESLKGGRKDTKGKEGSVGVSSAASGLHRNAASWHPKHQSRVLLDESRGGQLSTENAVVVSKKSRRKRREEPKSYTEDTQGSVQAGASLSSKLKSGARGKSVKYGSTLWTDGMRVDGEEGRNSLLGLGEFLAPGSAPLVDMRPFCTKRSHCPEKVRNLGDVNVRRLLNVTQSGAWVVHMLLFTEEAVKKAVEMKTGYFDRKYVLMGTRASGWLKMRFSGLSESKSVIICEGPCEYQDECSSMRGRLANDALFKIDDQDIPKQDSGVGFTSVSDLCVKLTGPKSLKGSHTVGIRSSRGKMLMVSQVIWF
eukprot:CAMPEP_0196580786 /NCGR_PEP_ID=MMETSP1081-20130531/30578_1 /TAXON_ID=36882 /ORGANISM="Pyramimonas amylifera, Strain CCMP720" /LENGTH=412 /DNA_ID=CAMNT_0041900769 /DNA_START=80 /DNA_END=1318 /DNA_ORIENTATION=+